MYDVYVTMVTCDCMHYNVSIHLRSNLCWNNVFELCMQLCCYERVGSCCIFLERRTLNLLLDKFCDFGGVLDGIVSENFYK